MHSNISIYRKSYRTDLTVCAAFVSRKTARTAGGHDFSFSLGKNFELFFKPRQIVSWLDGKLLLGKVMRGQKCCNKVEQFVAIPGISDDLFLYCRQHHDQSDPIPNKQTERKRK